MGLLGLFGPPNVENMKAKRDVKGLVKALGYEKDAAIRKSAARALGEIRDPMAVDPLIAASKDKNFDVQQSAILALGRIGDTRAVAHLAAILRNDISEAARQIAAWSLRQVGPAAIPSLGHALMDHAWLVQEIAAESLEKLGWQPDVGQPGAAYWIVKQQWDKCVGIGRPAVPPLIVALANKGNRHSAAKALGQIGDDRAVGPLMAGLQDSNKSFRQIAAEALTQMYKSGRLDNAHKQLILAQRDKITQRHEDQMAHSDDNSAFSSDCTHNDNNSHADTGIGVSFSI
jgi:HEAT repeat protein